MFVALIGLAAVMEGVQWYFNPVPLVPPIAYVFLDLLNASKPIKGRAAHVNVGVLFEPSIIIFIILY